jgi:hypothetical protein
MASQGPFSYVVTSQKPTGVTHALVGAFTRPDSRNLILAKTTRIELYSLDDGGLDPVFEVPVFGRVACMELIRLEVCLWQCV